MGVFVGSIEREGKGERKRRERKEGRNHVAFDFCFLLVHEMIDPLSANGSLLASG